MPRPPRARPESRPAVPAVTDQAATRAGQAPDGVLITRPEPGASETARRVAALGFTPVLAPSLVVRSLPARLPERADAVVLPSGNAVATLPPSLHAVPVLAVGDATAARARGAGFTDVRSADGDAVALTALAREALPAGGRVLLACGRGQSIALAAGLRAAGLRVHRRAVYAARPAAALPPEATEALRAGGLRAALFLSAETARAFVRLLPLALRPHLGHVDALAIGRPAADALGALPWRRVRVSVRPNLDSVLALI